MSNDSDPAPSPAAPVPRRHKTTLAFKVGLIFLLINIPVGYGGFALGTSIYYATGKSYWLWIGSGAYAISWVLLGAGIALAGPAGVAYMKDFWKSMRPSRKSSPPEA